MKRLAEDQTLVCDAQSTPAAQLLAFTLWVRQFDLRQTRFWVRIPRNVFQALTPDAFKEIFSDLMLEDDPEVEQRMQVYVSSEPGFGLGTQASGAGPGGGLSPLDRPHA